MPIPEDQAVLKGTRFFLQKKMWKQKTTDIFNSLPKEKKRSAELLRTLAVSQAALRQLKLGLFWRRWNMISSTCSIKWDTATASCVSMCVRACVYVYVWGGWGWGPGTEASQRKNVGRKKLVPPPQKRGPEQRDVIPSSLRKGWGKRGAVKQEWEYNLSPNSDSFYSISLSYNPHILSVASKFILRLVCFFFLM